QGGKYFGWNGKVLTARLQIGGRPWQWPLKVIDEEKAEALMAPLRVARERLHQAAAEELNCELGTDAAVAAAAARVIARGQLAVAIITAGGPKELADFVTKGPKGEVGTSSPLPVAVALKGTKQAKVKQCVEWVADLIRANPDRPPVLLAELRKQAKVEVWGAEEAVRGREQLLPSPGSKADEEFQMEERRPSAGITCTNNLYQQPVPTTCTKKIILAQFRRVGSCGLLTYLTERFVCALPRSWRGPLPPAPPPTPPFRRPPRPR